MIKKTIKFEDLDGNEVEEDFYFHLSKAELIELEASVGGGLSGYLRKLIASEDGADIIAVFKKIILLSVGERSSDGRRFIKNQELTDAFAQTDAYSSLFMELATDADKANAFINGVLPTSLAKKVDEVLPNPAELSREELLKRLEALPKES